MFRYSSWGCLLLLALGLLLGFPLSAQAAPDRLNDDVPDAVMDQPGAISFTFSHEALQLEGPLNDENIAHDYFKLRYTLNPKTALTFRYGTHNLNGGLALVNPLFDNRDGGESYTFDLALNLLNVEAVPADPDNNKEFEAGSAFNVGVSGTMYQMDMGDLASEDSLLRAYLVYTTDLSPEMRAHTIFTTSRISGDSASGSLNRIGAGLDYTLIDGSRPLTLMANAVLDVYNFRQPDFNTSRISSFDVGLRYRVARNWYTSLGYKTYNDSENDATGSGIFASVQYVDEPGPCVTCEPVPEEELPPAPAPAEGETALNNTVAPAPPPAAAQPMPAQATATAEPPAQPATAAAESEPALMKNTTPPADEARQPDAGFRQTVEQPAQAGEQAPSESEQPAADEETDQESVDSAEQPPADTEEQLPADTEEQPPADSEQQQPAAESEEQQPAGTDNESEAEIEGNAAPADSTTEAGIMIPELPLEHPHQTPAGAIMVRADGAAPNSAPRYTSSNDVLLRAPVDSATANTAEDLVAQQTTSEEPSSETALIAMHTGAAVLSDEAVPEDATAPEGDAATTPPAKTASEAESSEEQ